MEKEKEDQNRTSHKLSRICRGETIGKHNERRNQIKTKKKDKTKRQTYPLQDVQHHSEGQVKAGG